MITRRASILALFFVVACVRAQILPVSSAGDDNDCALYLTGPGRSSAFDYNLNLLRGSLHYEGQHTCITYDAVNAAYIDARKRINVATPKGDWKTEDIASVGELMLDISINLARTYGLTYEDIEKGLPLIDTTKTLIREVCPPFLSHVECRAGKYRRFDGLCTNLAHPTWGASMTPFQRLIAPLYADGINAPRVSVTGRDLPLSRVVSRTMHPDDGFHDHAGTVMVIAWGQFMDHDYTLTGTPLDPRNRNDPEECCNRPPHRKHPYCNELRIPDDDYFYRLFNVKCIDFVRGFPSPRAGCRLGSRQQFNTLTGVLDGNTVYGVTEKFSRKLRSGVGGLLRMNPVFEEYGLKDLLPLKLDIPDEGCTRPNKSMYCFEAGEIRVNEQLVLTCMHTLMAREHNRVARGLGEVNPHWDDETVFQESRRIIIAEIQHITYNEFLPILLGKEVMEKFGLLLNKEGYWDGYDENVNPSVIDAFSAAAFRFGHSLLPTAVERWSKAHKFISSKRLSDLIRRPFDLYRAGIFDEYLMGLMNQVAQAMDDSITQEVTNHLFKKPGARFGMDLVSFNMQRGREFGLPGYMEFRKFCGLPGAGSFQELFGSMPNETIQRYESIFEHPSDVDLWSGGVSERPLPGSMLGPTFACVIATQFSYSRRGDRFWYELPNQPSSFTPEQLAELKKARLARVICDNTDIIDTVQVYPMVLPDHEINPRVPCRSGIMPSMDFTKWADYGDQHNIPSNPYEKETQVTYPNITTPDNTTSDDTGNKTTINLLQFIKPKSTGHYKNSLRRKRRDIINFNTNGTLEETVNNTNNTNDIINASNTTDTTKHTDIITDSEVAAITVTEVTGSYNTENEHLPETTVPNDQRDETAPQTFTLRTNINSDNGFRNRYFQNKFDDEEQVSQKSPREHLKLADHNIHVDTDYKFIADTEENGKITKEEGSQPITKGYDNHVWKKSNHNKERFGKHGLGFGEDRANQPHFPGTFADESDEFDHRVEKQHSNRDPERRFRTGSRGPSRTASSVSGSGRHAKLTKGIRQTGGSSLERLNTKAKDFQEVGDEHSNEHGDEYEDDKEGEREDEYQEEEDQFEKKASEKQNLESENVKDQYEHVPLDYNHDKVQENKKENLKSRSKEQKIILPKLELGDTRVSLPEIRLPEIVFGVYNDDYFNSLRSTNKRGKPSDYVYVDTDENEDDNEEDNEKEEDEEEEEDVGRYRGGFNPYKGSSNAEEHEEYESHIPNFEEDYNPEENPPGDISLENPNIRIRYGKNLEDENEDNDDETNEKEETDVVETINNNVGNEDENKNVLNERYKRRKNKNRRNNRNFKNNNRRHCDNENYNQINSDEDIGDKKPQQDESKEEEEYNDDETNEKEETDVVETRNNNEGNDDENKNVLNERYKRRKNKNRRNNRNLKNNNRRHCDNENYNQINSDEDIGDKKPQQEESKEEEEYNDDETNEKEETDVEETRNNNEGNDEENKNVLNERYKRRKTRNRRNNRNFKNNNRRHCDNENYNQININTDEDIGAKKPQQDESKGEEEYNDDETNEKEENDVEETRNNNEGNDDENKNVLNEHYKRKIKNRKNKNRRNNQKPQKNKRRHNYNENNNEINSNEESDEKKPQQDEIKEEGEYNDDNINKKDETYVEETRNNNVGNDDENKNVLKGRGRYKRRKNKNRRNNHKSLKNNRRRNDNENNDEINTNEKYSEKKPQRDKDKEYKEENDDQIEQGSDTKDSPVIIHPAKENDNIKKVRAKNKRRENSKVLKNIPHDGKDISERVKEYVS